MLSARTRPLSRGRAFRVNFRKHNARNGTRPEPRLRIILFVFKTRHSLEPQNGWKISSFPKLEIEHNNIGIFPIRCVYFRKHGFFESFYLWEK